MLRPADRARRACSIGTAVALSACGSVGGAPPRAPDAAARPTPPPASDAPLPSPRPAPSPASPSPAATAASPAPPTAVSTWREVVAALRADPASARFLDVLAAAERAAPTAGAETRIQRVPDLEAASRAAVGRGTAWAIVTTYVEAGGDATALRAAYLDLDRVVEWTGKPGAHRLETRGDVVVGMADALRTAFSFRYGARWRFEARAVDLGGARCLLSHQVEDPATVAMITTHGVLLAVPEPGGVRVVECSTSVLDYEVPALLRTLAAGAAQQEMRARVEGIRAHWREYLPKAR